MSRVPLCGRFHVTMAGKALAVSTPVTSMDKVLSTVGSN